MKLSELGIDYQMVPLERRKKAQNSPFDYQPLTTLPRFLVYFIPCHALLISKLHFCLSVRSERDCKMAPKGTFTVVCYAKDGMGASSVALSRDTFTAVCYARVPLY